MSYLIRSVTKNDEDSLWVMLFYAAHMDEESDKTVADAMKNPDLAKYVTDWGRDGDLGFLAVNDEKVVGAVWVRLYEGGAYSQTDANTPELAIALLPDTIGQGIGTALMNQLIDSAKEMFPAIALNVRADNPALRLYQRLGFKTVREMTNRVGTLSYDMILNFDEATLNK